MRAAKALGSLHIFVGLLELSLLDNMINIKLSCAGSSGSKLFDKLMLLL